jgi:hypothetical protein
LSLQYIFIRSSSHPPLIKILPPLYRKLFVLAFLIAVFAVGMATLLIGFKISNTQRELRHARFDLIAQDIDRVIEQSFALGLNFNELSALPTALMRRKAADSAITAIDVADRDGRIVYSTENNHIGQQTPTEWRAIIRQKIALPLASPADSRWRAQGESEAVAGAIVVNSFSIKEGWVAVRYHRSVALNTYADLWVALKTTVIITLVVTTLLLFGLFAILMRRFERNTTKAADLLMSESAVIDARSGWSHQLQPLVAHIDAARRALAAWKARR